MVSCQSGSSAAAPPTGVSRIATEHKVDLISGRFHNNNKLRVQQWAPAAISMTNYNQNNNDNKNIAVGKYLVTPLVKQLDDGCFAASVSIRSGRGSGMHDRVLRFTERFGCDSAAVRYATEQGLSWIRGRSSPAMAAA